MKPRIEYAPTWGQRLGSVSVLWSRWWSRRDRRCLLRGLPALFFLLVIATLILFVTPSRGDIERNYLAEGIRRSHDKDYDGATLCFDRLWTTGVSTWELGFNTAINLLAKAESEQEKNPSEAVELNRRALDMLNELAPEGKLGYAPAHVWQARRLLEKQQRTDQDLEKAEDHLTRALSTQGFDDPEAEQMLGQVYLQLALHDTNLPRQNERFQKSENLLEKATKRRPEAKLQLAKTLTALGKRDLSRKLITEVIAEDRGKLLVDDTNPRPGWSWRRPWSISSNGRKPSMSWRRAGTSSPWRSIGNCWARRTRRGPMRWSKDGKSSPEEQWDKLAKALLYDPENIEIVKAVFSIFDSKDNKVLPQLRKTLLNMATSGKEGAGLANFCLGIDALRRGESATAQEFFEKALTDAPYLIDSAFWLMQLYANQRRIPEAMRVADGALTRLPNDPRLRRPGRVLYLNRRNEKGEPDPDLDSALNDLKVALRADSEDPKTHVMLAEVYSQLGKKQDAELHKNRAKELDLKWKAAEQQAKEQKRKARNSGMMSRRNRA